MPKWFRKSAHRASEGTADGDLRELARKVTKTCDLQFRDRNWGEWSMRTPGEPPERCLVRGDCLIRTPVSVGQYHIKLLAG